MGVYTTQAQFRKYSNEFLNIGAGARGLGMGSAQAASASDGTAGYWNPAGLIGVTDGPELNFMHANYFSGIAKYDFGNFTLPARNGKRAFGITALRFGVDDIMNTLFLVEPDGSLNYNNISSFSSADYAFLLSGAQQLKKTANTEVRLGFNGKVIHRSVGQFAKAWGFGMDAGLQIIKKKWRIGLMAHDISTTFNTWQFTFTDAEKQILYLTQNDIPVKSTEQTAPHVSLGFAKDFSFGKNSGLLAEADFDITMDGQRNTLLSGDPVSIDPKLGLEARIKNTLFIRAGVNNFQQALANSDTLNRKQVWIFQPSVGVGFKVQGISLDYAFTNLANQSNPLFTHVFSLKFNFKRKKEEE